MSAAADLVAALRLELASLSARIRGHAYVAALESGSLPRERLRLFAGEQYHIIRHDLRSFALLLSRQADIADARHFRASVEYEAAALDALFGFAAALAMSEADLQAYEPMAETQAYTAFLAFVAVHHSAAEMAAAFVIDLEGWGGNCGAMGRALRRRYGFDEAALGFFAHFAAQDPRFEPSSLEVIDRGLAAGVPEREIRRTARLMLEYEAMYWDGILRASAT
jgi:pyrroloquinoline quinone (PQQ) biosynthesis protein C